MPNLFWFATVLFKIFGKFGYRCVVFACDVKSCQTLYYQELPAHTDHRLEAFFNDKCYISRPDPIHTFTSDPIHKT